MRQAHTTSVPALASSSSTGTHARPRNCASSTPSTSTSAGSESGEAVSATRAGSRRPLWLTTSSPDRVSVAGLSTRVRWRAISAQRIRRISSVVLPLNMGPVMTVNMDAPPRIPHGRRSPHVQPDASAAPRHDPESASGDHRAGPAGAFSPRAPRRSAVRRAPCRRGPRGRRVRGSRRRRAPRCRLAPSGRVPRTRARMC